MITIELLRSVAPSTKDATLGMYVQPLEDTCLQYEINTKLRLAAFLAQIAHESGGFIYTLELSSGEQYEYRKDLGNNLPGDGVRYKGRGLIQITGKANYQRVGQALGVAFVAYPELLEQPGYAAQSAGWFWQSRNLNPLADEGEFETITKRINGGLNGYEDRLQRYTAALSYIGQTLLA